MPGQQRERPPTVSRAPQFDPALIAAAQQNGGPGPESILPEASPHVEEAAEGAPELNFAPDRRPVKVTLYIDQALADRLEDTTLVWQRRHRKRKKLEKGMVADALLAAGLEHLKEAEAWLKRTYVR